MSIPKGLLLYKASRHQSSFPNDIKYGYYSEKMVTSISAKEKKRSFNFHRKYQQKLIQEADIRFDKDGSKTLEIIKIFSKFRGIKKCSINWFSFRPGKETEALRIRVLQRLFKILKRIKHLTIQSLDLSKLQQNPKTFKTFLQLKNLESLTFSGFNYSADSKDLKPFLQVAKVASKRVSWPHLKSLTIYPFYPKISRLTDDLSQILENLSEFLQEFKSCPNLYQCTRLGLKLPNCENLDSEEAEILKEITRNAPVLGVLEMSDFEYFSDIFKVLKQSKGLKRLELRSLQKLKETSDLNVLKNISSTLQELKLSRYHEEASDLILYKDLLGQVQSMKNLKVLTFEFLKNLSLSEELKDELLKVISGLDKLESLKFDLLYFSKETGKNKKESDRLWLVDIFQGIGNKPSLRKLSLRLADFDCEDSDVIFKVLCESLKKLTQLDDLSLMMSKIDDKKLLMFIKSLSKLTKLQSLQLEINCHNSKFQSETFELLIESITNNLFLLSQLSLTISKTTATKQAFEILFKMIHKLKYLNSMKLIHQGKLETGLDFQLLVNEMKKRFTGYISHNIHEYS